MLKIPSKFKSTKYQKLILISFLFTSFLFLYPTIFSKPSIYPIRSLTSSNHLEDICEQTSKSFFSFYKENPFHFSYQISSKGRPNPLIQYIEDSNIKHLKDYIPRIIPYLVFIAIFGLFLICFVIYCFICCCCPKCCCFPKTNQVNYNNCGSCTFISAVVFYCLVLISLMINILLSKNLKESMNEAMCSLLILPFSLDEGLKNNSFSNWKGTTSIIKTMNSTANIVNVITKNKDNYFNFEYLNKSISTFNEYVKDIEHQYSNKNIKHPDPNNSNYIQPVYIQSNLKLIVNETKDRFNASIMLPYLHFYNVVTITNDLGYSKDNVIRSLNTSILKLNNVDELVFKFISTKGNKLINIQKNLNDYGYFIFFICLCFIGILSLFGILFVIIYSVVTACQKIRYALNMIWILIMIMTIFNFIYGIGFGLIGLISVDYALVLYNVLSSKNLNDEFPLLIHNTNASIVFDRCINKDGNLSLEFGFYNETLNNENGKQYNYVQSLYNYYPIIHELYNHNLEQMNVYKNLIQLSMNELDLYKSNMYLVYNDLEIMLNEINSYTNIESYYDIWIIENAECPKENNIVNDFDLNETPKCIVINNSIDLFNCDERYNLLPNSSRICNVIFSINEFINKNNELIMNIQNDINQLSLLFSELYIEIQSKLNFSNLVVSNLYDIYNPLLNDTNQTEIFSILDCSYLKPYSNKMYESLERKLSKESFIFSSFLLCTCFLCWNTATFSLLVIGKFKMETAIMVNTEIDDKSMFIKPQKLNIVDGGNGNLLKNGEKIIIQKVKVDESIKINN